MAEPAAPPCVIVFVCPACTLAAQLDAHKGPARCFGPTGAPHVPVFMVAERVAS